MLGGVCAGLADRLGVDVNVVRIATTGTALAGGFGALVYVIAWLALPPAGADRSLIQRIVRDRQERATLLGLGLVAASVLVVVRLLGVWLSGIIWPLGLAAAGVGLVWWEGGPSEREPILRVLTAIPGLRVGGDRRQRRLALLRTGFGAAMVFGGIAALLAQAGALPALRGAVVGTVLVVGGVALACGPWWWRLAGELAEERRSRVRSQERAEVAAHLHDSVLQTLALIQKAADDPRRVTALARRQERELRAWLFGGAPAIDGALTLAGAVQGAADEVEELHGTPVELVLVGADPPVDAELAALVAALREAMVNAAKWSGAASISAYVEVEDGVVSAFVRDRGVGFDLGAVAHDRRGIADSIVRRVERHGGKAVVRSTPGEGTEVELRLHRRAAP